MGHRRLFRTTSLLFGCFDQLFDREPNLRQAHRWTMSIKQMLIATAIVAIDLCVLLSASAFLFSASVIVTACGFAAILSHRCHINRVQSAAWSFWFCLTHSAILGASQSAYLLTFYPSRAANSFGLGNPIAGAIVAAILSIPYALMCSIISFVVAGGIGQFRFIDKPLKDSIADANKADQRQIAVEDVDRPLY